MSETAATSKELASYSIYQFSSQLVDLMNFREDAQTEEERAAAEQAIANYFSGAAAQVDDLLGFARHCEVLSAAAVAEAKRQRANAEKFDRWLTRLEDAVKGTLELAGQKRLAGKLGCFLLKGNGGPQPLEIRDPEMIPDELCEYTIAVDAERFWAIVRKIALKPSEYTRAVNNAAVRAALATECPVCFGRGTQPSPEGGAMTCRTCGGSGMAGVPGAKLIPRGAHIEIKS